VLVSFLCTQRKLMQAEHLPHLRPSVPPLAGWGAFAQHNGTTASAQEVAIEAKRFLRLCDLPLLAALTRSLKKRSDVIIPKGRVGTVVSVRKEFSNPVDMIGNPVWRQQAVLREELSEVVHVDAFRRFNRPLVNHRQGIKTLQKGPQRALFRGQKAS
jgi:hypothetical protein